MIEHVRRRVALAPSISQVIVATCDQEIVNTVSASGGMAVLTAPTHERCTDRVAEAARGLDADIIINVQGDEPCVMPAMLEALVNPLVEDQNVLCTNLMAPIKDDGEFGNPDVVKLVVNRKGEALYFSREPVPSPRKAANGNYEKYKQLGIVAFRRDFLQTFTQLPPTPIETVESVDMMRALEHGYSVWMVKCEQGIVGVDRPSDVERAAAILSKDPLVQRYYQAERRHSFAGGLLPS